jgi:uncharacterized membrane protein
VGGTRGPPFQREGTARPLHRVRGRTKLEPAPVERRPAAVSAVPVLASRLAAWQWALEGQTLKGILLLHLILGCLSSGLMWLVFWIHWRVRRHREESWPQFRLAIEAVAVLLVGLTAHLGGFLSCVNGPG